LIKLKNKNESSKKEALLMLDEDKINSKLKNINNKVLSEESIETKTKEEIKNNNKINYGKEEVKKLIQNYGTPYYPDDINDEIYPQEIQAAHSKNKNKNEKKNFKDEEVEYMPVNNLLSSQDSIKNNYIKTINEININKLQSDKRQLNNITINNNFITNNVLAKIQTSKIQNELSTFHFGFNYKSKKENESSIKSRQNNETSKIYNLAIFKNSFELSAFKNEEKIDVDLKNILEEKDENRKENKEIFDKKENKIFNNNSKSDSYSSGSDSQSSSSSRSSSKKEENKKPEKSFTCEIPVKKLMHSSSSSSATIKQNINIDKKFMIYENKRLKFNAEYFNINQITKGKFAKNKGFQDYIKKIIIQKMSDLNHSRIELPEIRHLINTNRASLPNSKKKISKKYTAFLPFNVFRNDKGKMNTNKNQRSNLMDSELNPEGKESNIGKKKLIRKSNNNITFMNYINRNIRDDSAVLNNPGKFYGGLFNDIMKKYTKANIKQFPK
jgi:hypothetical protein